MKLVKWIEITERALDVVRIALEEARTAKEQDASPAPPPPVQEDEDEPTTHPPRYEFGYDPEGTWEVRVSTWSVEDHGYGTPAGMWPKEVVETLNHYVKILDSFEYFD
jgi:hypothetical protein